MSDSEAVLLRLPRLVTGIPARCREVERVAVWDDVPVKVRSCGPHDAPVAFVKVAPTKRSDVRVLGDAAYLRLASAATAPSAAWRMLADQVSAHVADDLRMGPAAARSGFTKLTDWPRLLGPASRKRGISDYRDGAFRDVRDDGLDAQARMAARFAERLLVVGGELWFRAAPPRITVVATCGEVLTSARAELLEWDQDPRVGCHPGAGDFRADRPDEAAAFAADLRAATGLPDSRVANPGVVEVVDAARAAAFYAASRSDELMGLHAVGRGIVAAARAELGMLAEEAILAHAELLRLLRADDADGLHAWMEGELDGFREALSARKGHPARDRLGAGEDELGQVDAAILRYRNFEAPRRELLAGDAAALSSL